MQLNQLFKVLRVLRAGRMIKRIETKTAVRMSMLTVVKARLPGLVLVDSGPDDRL